VLAGLQRAHNVAYWKSRAEKGEALLQTALSDATQFLRDIFFQRSQDDQNDQS
jgi:hypothetical protein